jgi:RimJ/RimL family protein N-acetyltransferase
MLEGLLVDLVPYGSRFVEHEPEWRNNEAWFWATMGDRHAIPKTVLDRRRQERAEWVEQHGSHEVWFGIQTKDGTPIGDIAMNWVLPYQRLAMLGASIGKEEYWGGGYGTDALLLIMDYAFDWHDLRKLWLGTMSPNVRVTRQMEKVGFKLEARQRQVTWVDGAWADGLLYGILREEWPGRPALIEKLGLRARQGEA